MPRKYRPPTTKRRKARKTTIPYEFERPDESSVDSNGADDAPILAVDVAEVEPEPEDAPIPRSTGRGERHVGRDYSYVRGEIVRIVVIATFLIVALVITGILR